jgi:TolB protein
MDALGKQHQRLTAFHRDDWNALPSPDGKTIAFVSDREGPPRIFLMKSDGTQLRRLTDRAEADTDEEAPSWSPDGTTIAYVAAVAGKSSQVWLHDLGTSKARAVTPTPIGAKDVEPAWSPDGKWVVVVRDDDLWATNGVDHVQITAGAAVERLPRWR